MTLARLGTPLFALALLVALTAAAPCARAQSLVQGRGVRRPPEFGAPVTPEMLYAAAKPPELTYSNRQYGFSFRFPSNFFFGRFSDFGEGAQRNPDPRGDRGEITLAEVTLPDAFWRGMNAGGIVLTVGVNPTLSAQSCGALVAPNEFTSGDALHPSAEGLELAGRNDIEHGTQYGRTNKYQRLYTGFSNGICYEFETVLSTLNEAQMRLPLPLIQADPDRILAEMDAIVRTARIEAPNPGLKPEYVTQPWETSLPFPKELAGLGDLTDWRVRYPTGAPPMLALRSAWQICGTGDSREYMLITFEHVASSLLDNAAAKAEVDNLNAGVVRLIVKNGWTKVPKSITGPVDTSDCFVRDSTFVTIDKGTGRCTTGTQAPCTAYDSSEISVFIPTPATGASQ